MTTVVDVLNIARSQIGYVEGGGTGGHSGNITKYWAELEPGYQGQPWCAAFVSWCFIHAGLPLPPIDHSWGFSYCPDAVSYYRSIGRLFPTPEVGDIALYGFGSSTAVHTELVEAAGNPAFTAIGGNTSAGDSGSQTNGGGVYRRTRYISSVIGFARPVYLVPEEDPLFTPDDHQMLVNIQNALDAYNRAGLEQRVENTEAALARIEPAIVAMRAKLGA